MPNFSLESTDFAEGYLLLEASAGTGKTYSLEGIAAILVAEYGIAVERILMVTYTKAAAADLKTRVYRRLRSLAEIADNLSNDTPDPVARRFARASQNAQAIYRTRLATAVACFDEAQVSTIHSFCQKTLQDYAFESQSVFDARMLTDTRALLQEVTLDFWRRHFYQGATAAIACAVAAMQGIRPHHLLSALETQQRNPYAHIDPPPVPWETLAGYLRTIVNLLTQLRAALATHFDPLRHYFEDDTLWDGRRFKREKRVACVESMERLLAEKPEGAHSPNELAFFAEVMTLERIENRLVKAHKSRLGDFEATLFAPSSELLKVCSAYGKQLVPVFLKDAQARLESAKERRNALTYNDLIVRLHTAIMSDNSPLLAGLRGRYDVALVDEFQDTDALQYQIFNRLFSGAGKRLYCVGDPKQSIYRFRGADMQVYKEARNAIREEQRLALVNNYRSSPALIHAVNALFHDQTFESIAFTPSESPATTRNEVFSLVSRGKPSAPFVFLSLGDQPTENRVVQTCVQQIQQLLSETKISDVSSNKLRSVRCKDIAILARDRYQIGGIARALTASGIPYRLKSNARVWETEEANALRTVLHGIEECNRVACVKGALVTPLIGGSIHDIARMDAEDAQADEVFSLFADLKELWLRYGIMQAFRYFWIKYNVRVRLLAQPDGELVLGNYLHLADLLHERELAARASPESLLTWFDARVNPTEGAETDETDGMSSDQLRVASDGDVITLSTIHASKGLEYPIVICPYLWKPENPRTHDYRFHYSPESGELVLDCERGDTSKAAETQSAQADNDRLLYVALTRAKYACLVMLGQCYTRNKEPSPLNNCSLARLCLGNPILEGARKLAEQDPNMFSMIDPFEESEENGATANIVTEYANELETLPRAQIFTRNLERFDRLGNFSKFTYGVSHDREMWRADEPENESDAYDKTHQELNAKEPITDATRDSKDPLPKGKKMGNALHDLLERTDFQNFDPDLVQPILSEYGYPEIEYKEYITARMEHWLTTPLANDSSLRLCDIGKKQRISELEFYFPLKTFTRQSLQDVLAEFSGLPHGIIRSLDQLRIHPVRGWMNGFIDLVFEHGGKYYILDWKSNTLGDTPMAYTETAIRQEMVASLYPLQYLIYTVALHKHLSRTLNNYAYETHFGGVFYVFLRGFGIQPGHSVFYDRPSEANIEHLTQLFSDETS